MKTLFKTFGIIIAIILLALIIVPYLFSDKIEEIVKREINNYVDATVDYKDFSLSIFSSFPDLQASLEDVSIVGKDKFKNDTLAYIGYFAAEVNIMSVFDFICSLFKIKVCKFAQKLNIFLWHSAFSNHFE